jgi:hypothetical protein
VAAPRKATQHEIGLTLAAHLSAEFFLERDLDPAKLGIALRAARPLARGIFLQAEMSLYERSLDEAIRYMVGVAQNLPRFEVQAAATALGRLSRIGGDLEKVLDGLVVRQVVAQREPPVMLRVWGRVERVPADDASCLALWERCAYPR